MTIKLIKPYHRNPIIFQSKNLDKIKSFLTNHNTKDWIIKKVIELTPKKKSIKIKMSRSKIVGDTITY